MSTRAMLGSLVVGVSLLGLLAAPAASHEWSQAEMEALVRSEILKHEQQRRLVALCSDIHERIVRGAEQCVERHERGLSTPPCHVADLLREGAALRTGPLCQVFDAIATRCQKQYEEADSTSLSAGYAYLGCLKHPPVGWLEEAKDR